MCNINAYYCEDGREELLMESVEKVTPNDTKVCLENIYGQRVTINGRIKEVSLFNQRITIERLRMTKPGKNQETVDENCFGQSDKPDIAS